MLTSPKIFLCHYFIFFFFFLYLSNCFNLISHKLYFSQSLYFFPLAILFPILHTGRLLETSMFHEMMHTEARKQMQHLDKQKKSCLFIETPTLFIIEKKTATIMLNSRPTQPTLFSVAASVWLMHRPFFVWTDCLQEL